MLLGLLPAIHAGAQSSAAQTPSLYINIAEDQYLQQHYRLAAQSATKYIAAVKDWSPQWPFAKETNRAAYYISSSLLQLDSKGCADTAIAFLKQTASSAYHDRIAYALAHYYFIHNELAAAIPYYETADIANLSNRELIDEKFELAYCYFNNHQFDKATILLGAIKELQVGKYYIPGNYYYGLLAYNENNYKDALQSFERIKDLKEYQSIVPYYIAEIYYFTGEHERALVYSKELIARPEKLYYDNELHLLAGQCLFEDQKYSEALPYFEYYYNNIEQIRKEDLYEMAYCYFKTEQWVQAIDKFKPLGDAKDSLGQTAMYLLGDCYLHTNDKMSARTAFAICADMRFNPAQQEAALILYIKLSYEMGYDDNAMDALHTLLNNFPSSPYHDEAKTLLSGLLIRTSNYSDALVQLQDVSIKDEHYKRVAQKVTYGYAMQQLRNGDIQAADSFLTLSLQYPEDMDYEAVATFWKGELGYRMHHYKDAVSYNRDFISKDIRPQAVHRLSNAATVQHANLTIGYALMELDEYKDAQNYFSHAQHIDNEDSSTNTVALVREADAVFMQKDYNRAEALYDRIIAAKGEDADYARYQKAILLGLQGKDNEKTQLLQSVISQVPISKYAPNARYELGVTDIQVGKYAAAIAMLQPLIQDAATQSFAPKALLKMAFAYQQTDNADKAIAAYKKVITDYPVSPERLAALEALKNIYIEAGKPTEYTNLLKENNLPVADSGAADTTYYASAEAQFTSGRWDKAILAFTQYLAQYPAGIFTGKAHYYRAESYYQKKDYKSALMDYNIVLQSPWSDFSENSALRAGGIAYQQKDYTAAIGYYTQLRNNAIGNENLHYAYQGLMTASYAAAKYDMAANYADTLGTLPGKNEETDDLAILYKAKVLQHNGKADEALADYKLLEKTKNSETAAEARYHVAEIYFTQDKLKDAETAANFSIRQSAGYDYWIIRSYILLADVLTKEKDYFNAKATLQSIIKHAAIPELKEEAINKLEELKKLDKHKSKLSGE